MVQFIKSIREPIGGFHSIEVRRKINELNQEIDGIQNQRNEFLTRFLFANRGETADDYSMELPR